MDSFILYPDGQVEEIVPHDGEYFSFEELSNLVDGQPIAFPLPDQNLMVFDNEAKVKNKPVNLNAGNIFRGFFKNINETVSGIVLICKINQR